MDRRKKGIPKKRGKKFFLDFRKNFQNRQEFLLDAFTGPDIG
jgi:hypothetical protein